MAESDFPYPRGTAPPYGWMGWIKQDVSGWNTDESFKTNGSTLVHVKYLVSMTAQDFVNCINYGKQQGISTYLVATSTPGASTDAFWKAVHDAGVTENDFWGIYLPDESGDTGNFRSIVSNMKKYFPHAKAGNYSGSMGSASQDNPFLDIVDVSFFSTYTKFHSERPHCWPYANCIVNGPDWKAKGKCFFVATEALEESRSVNSSDPDMNTTRKVMDRHISQIVQGILGGAQGVFTYVYWKAKGTPCLDGWVEFGPKYKYLWPWIMKGDRLKLNVTNTSGRATISAYGQTVDGVTAYQFRDASGKVLIASSSMLDFTEATGGENKATINGVPAGTYEVLWENRTVQVTGSTITDTWQPYQYHFYLLGGTTPPSNDTGSIAVSSNVSGAAIYLDNSNTNHVTPYTLTSVSTGPHTITLKATGYADGSQSVTVAKDATASVSITLSATTAGTGSISVSSDPTGANIYLDNVNKSVITNNTLTNIPAGPHTVILKKSGYLDKSVDVTVTANNTATVSETLVKITPSTNYPHVWDFGDTEGSVEVSPTHTFTKAGSYTTSLTETNSVGSNTATKVITVTGSGNTVSPLLEEKIGIRTPGGMNNFEIIDPGTNVVFDDNTISSATPTTVSKTGNLGVGTNSSGTSRILIKRNVTDILDELVGTAVLKLYFIAPATARTQDTVLEVYRPATYSPDNVTWNNSDAGKVWTHKGGDYFDKNGVLNGSTPFGSVTIPKDKVADNIYHEIYITDLVRYYQGHNNDGFLIKAKNETSNNYIEFASQDVNGGANKPDIFVTTEVYVPMTPPYLYIKGAGMNVNSDFICTDSNADVEINQALKYAREHPEFTHIYLKGPFTYNISKQLIFGSNITIEGDSTAIIKLKNGANWSVSTPIFVQNSSTITNVNFRGFTVDGNAAGNESNVYVNNVGYYTFLLLLNATNVEISKMTFQNNLNDAIYLNNCAQVNIHENTITNPGNNAIYCISGESVTIDKNVITAKVGDGIKVYNTENLYITSNVISSNGVSGKHGIEIIKNGTPSMAQVIVDGNIVHDMPEAGIWSYGYGSYDPTFAYIYLTHNLVYKCGLKKTAYAAGILFNGFNGVIRNNTLDSNEGGGIIVKKAFTSDPIYAGNLAVLIENNNITNMKSGYGITCNYTLGYVLNVLYNFFFGNSTTGSGDYGTNVTHTHDIVDQDPLYIDPTNGDYHEKSKCGRWAGTGWTTDDTISPCIDAGNPETDYSRELDPWNGFRVNTGCFGGTVQASLTGTHAGPSNKAPVLAEVANQVVHATHELTFTLAAIDPENDTVTFSADPLPEGATLVPTTGVFTWTPTEDQVGSYTTTIAASDGVLRDTQVINISVLTSIIDININKTISARMKQSYPDTVFNSPAIMDLGGDGTNGFRSLLYTDFTEFVGETLTQADLSLFWFAPEGQERQNDTIIEVYRPIAWNPDFVSWNKKDNGLAWMSPGGDWYDKNATLNGDVPYGTLTIAKNDLPTNDFVVIDIIDLLQEYADNTHANTGILLKAKVEDNNYVGFYSSNLDVSAKKPKITIEYNE
jgi:hypothetical protein